MTSRGICPALSVLLPDGIVMRICFGSKCEHWRPKKDYCHYQVVLYGKMVDGVEED